ncbi:MAG: 16S rRNA (cytosine(1402)-N(4))-methyltransferase RsmH [Candidatus Obscuribacterales bacterium]|nr:16S rRNA (cytosine(1402)-N(4))-methyltransferase RsmH [Candidatus Obscuribacterales bacterium]
MAENNSFSHTPVLLAESMHWLNPRPGLVWVDATVGLGGHLSEIIKKAGPDSTVIGIDQDQEALDLAKERLKKDGLLDLCPNLHLVQGNFSNIEPILDELGIEAITGGILADIGVSSFQLDNSERGFSFQTTAPLDMRMNRDQTLTAETLVNTLPEIELANLIYRFGEEKFSRKIAKRIVDARPLKQTSELASIVMSAVGRARGGRGDYERIHPATRTFQALRIAVNDELGVLEKFMHDAIKKLKAEARIVVISFHSLEDRLVKQILKSHSISCICPPRYPICTCDKKQELKILTNKPLQPSDIETLANPRSRSAKLRAGERVG